MGRWEPIGRNPPRPAQSADGLKKAPAAIHPLPQGRERIVKDYAEPKKEKLLGFPEK
jgi:hypothetical protein